MPIIPSKLHTNDYFILSEKHISIPLRFISMILLRKTLSVTSAIHTGKPASCHCFHPAVFLRFWSSPRPISNSQLHTLLHFHLCPIYLIVSQGSYFLMDGISHLGGGFTLRCLQRLSLPDLATLPCRWSTTDTPVVRPARSSRTKASSSQISYARAG